MLAYIEYGWQSALETSVIFRYELPTSSFETIEDAGMWVSSKIVKPLDVTRIGNLPARISTADVELRVVSDLSRLRVAWDSTLHVSGIRLRNAKSWLE